MPLVSQTSEAKALKDYVISLLEDKNNVHLLKMLYDREFATTYTYPSNFDKSLINKINKTVSLPGRSFFIIAKFLNK